MRSNSSHFESIKEPGWSTYCLAEIVIQQKTRSLFSCFLFFVRDPITFIPLSYLNNILNSSEINTRDPI
jgi:hypothetical protein